MHYQQNSRVLYTFVPNKSFGQLLDISPKNSIFLKTFDSEFSYIEVWFTDQNSKPLEIEVKINITLVSNLSVKYKKMMCCSVRPRHQTFVKGYGFSSFAKSMGKNIGKNIRNILSGKYNQKLPDYTNNLQQMHSKLPQKK